MLGGKYLISDIYLEILIIRHRRHSSRSWLTTRDEGIAGALLNLDRSSNPPQPTSGRAGLVNPNDVIGNRTWGVATLGTEAEGSALSRGGASEGCAKLAATQNVEASKARAKPPGTCSFSCTPLPITAPPIQHLQSRCPGKGCWEVTAFAGAMPSPKMQTKSLVRYRHHQLQTRDLQDCNSHLHWVCLKQELNCAILRDFRNGAC